MNRQRLVLACFLAKDHGHKMHWPSFRWREFFLPSQTLAQVKVKALVQEIGLGLGIAPWLSPPRVAVHVLVGLSTAIVL